jgi:hypothetical protein
MCARTYVGRHVYPPIRLFNCLCVMPAPSVISASFPALEIPDQRRVCSWGGGEGLTALLCALVASSQLAIGIAAHGPLRTSLTVTATTRSCSLRGHTCTRADYKVSGEGQPTLFVCQKCAQPGQTLAPHPLSGYLEHLSRANSSTGGGWPQGRTDFKKGQPECFQTCTSRGDQSSARVQVG